MRRSGEIKIGIITNAFNEPNLIKGCIKQFEPFNFKHLVLCSERPWNGSWQRDNTASIAADYGATVLIKDWRTEAEQFNYGLKCLNNYDWALIVDADERYIQEDIENLIYELENLDKIGMSGARTHTMNIYWKTPDYRIDTNNIYFPVIAVKPSIRFYDKRNSNAMCGHSSAVLYHFSYVRSDKEMKKKIDSFSHSEEFDKENWYNNIWLKWTPELSGLHPIVPFEFKGAFYDPAPNEIRELLNV